MTANQTVVVYEKPMQHLGLDDWAARLTTLRNVADLRRSDAFELRHSSRNLRNETRIQTDWDTRHNDARLADRVAELERWRNSMRACMERIERETSLLLDEKNSTERELDAMVMPLGVVAECLSQRDCRLGAELTYDEGDTELKKELCIIENNQKILRDQCQAAWEKLRRLGEVKFKVGLEVANKSEAIECDVKQMGLNKFCANITFKPDALRTPKNSCTYNGWLEHTRQMKQLADNELEDTYAMRESLFVCREKARNILQAQQDRTEHTIRKRIFETQRGRNEMEWQLKKIRDEMEKCIAEIKTLEQAYRDKTDAHKLAETRLENRAQRSGMELCTDEAHEGLCNEVHRLRQTRRALSDKIDCAKTTYVALEAHAVRLDRDLANKQHALMTDMRGMDMRARLRSGVNCAGPKTQTDRNIMLTRMEAQIPPE